VLSRREVHDRLNDIAIGSRECHFGVFSRNSCLTDDQLYIFLELRLTSTKKEKKKKRMRCDGTKTTSTTTTENTTTRKREPDVFLLTSVGELDEEDEAGATMTMGFVGFLSLQNSAGINTIPLSLLLYYFFLSLIFSSFFFSFDSVFESFRFSQSVVPTQSVL